MKILLTLSALFLSTAAVSQTPTLTINDLLAVSPRTGAQGVLSPDGKYFAELDAGQIVVVPSGSGTRHAVTASTGVKSEVSWSLDSKQLAYISQGDVWAAPLAGGVERRLTHDPVGPGDPRGASDHHPLWNANGRWILYQSGRKGFDELYVVSEDGSQQHLLAATEIYTGADVIPNAAIDHRDAVSSDRFDPNPQWSPEGTQISYTERSRQYFSGKLNVLLFDVHKGQASGAPRTIYTAKNDPGGAWAVNTAAWSPDNKTLTVVLQESGWDKLWQVAVSGGTPRTLTTRAGEDEAPVYSPDGKWIVFTSNRDLAEERHLWLVSSLGGGAHRLTSLAGIEGMPQWSPDSRTIYFNHASSVGAPASFSAAVVNLQTHMHSPRRPPQSGSSLRLRTSRAKTACHSRASCTSQPATSRERDTRHTTLGDCSCSTVLTFVKALTEAANGNLGSVYPYASAYPSRRAGSAGSSAGIHRVSSSGST